MVHKIISKFSNSLKHFFSLGECWGVSFLGEILDKPYRFNKVSVIHVKGKQVKTDSSSSLCILGNDYISVYFVSNKCFCTDSFFVVFQSIASETKITFANESIVN